MSEGFNEKVMHKLGKIEGKQDLILDNIKTQSNKIEANSERITNVEKRQVYISGGASVVALILGCTS